MCGHVWPFDARLSALLQVANAKSMGTTSCCCSRPPRAFSKPKREHNTVACCGSAGTTPAAGASPSGCARQGAMAAAMNPDEMTRRFGDEVFGAAVPDIKADSVVLDIAMHPLQDVCAFGSIAGTVEL